MVGIRRQLSNARCKDMPIVLSTVRELGLALPTSAIVVELMNAMIAEGGSEQVGQVPSHLHSICR
jgi:3-hydroxyisobutyrate dehydrogenase-like beta-hydroxyacid dehydrogenase